MKILHRWWRALSRKQRRLSALMAVSLFVTSWAIGWHAGRLLSPDYDSPYAPSCFIASNFTITGATRDDVVLSVAAGLKSYRYSLKDDKVTVELPPAQQMAALELPRRNGWVERQRLVELAGLIAAPGGALALWSAAEDGIDDVTAPTRRLFYGAAALLAVTGGALGFVLGYDDTLNYDSPIFSEGLKDSDNWRSFAQSIRDCNAVKRMNDALREDLERELADLETAPSNEPLSQESKVLMDKLEDQGRYCADFLRWSRRQPV